MQLKAVTFSKASGEDASAKSAGNNEAVSLLYAGSLEKATSRLAAVTTAMVDVDVSLIFNLSTLFELQSSTAKKNKLALVRCLASTPKRCDHHACPQMLRPWRPLKTLAP